MVGQVIRRVRATWRDPVAVGTGVQLGKTVFACVLSWVIVAEQLGLGQSFLAPWAALLVMHSTVYRSFAQGARQVGAAVIGVVLAWAVGSVLGVDAIAVAAVVLVGVAVGGWRLLQGETTTAAATALVVLTTGEAEEGVTLAVRLADTGIGVVVALVVNVLVWPPVWRRAAAAATFDLGGQVGHLLVDVADGLSEGYGEDEVTDWVDRTRRIESDIDRAWSLVRQAHESARLNPSRSAAEVRESGHWTERLERAEQALADTRSMVSTVGRRPDLRSVWQPAWRDGYVAILRASGRALAEGDIETMRSCQDRLDALAGMVEPGGESPLWPVYGGLLVNLRNILGAGELLAPVREGDLAPDPST